MIKNNNSQVSLRILFLGTGGTIAGLVSDGGTYQAAQLAVDALLPTFNGSPYDVTCEQLAQIDSKDMSFDVWERLYARITLALHDSALDAIVITHGTDTLEETAYFLSATLDATKPVILTGAMRPADAMDADGPQNLLDASSFAATRQAGVFVVFAGEIFPAYMVQKTHANDLAAFEALGAFDVPLKPLKMTIKDGQNWPRVEIVMSYAGASGGMVDALIAQKVDGIVVAATGNGTIHQDLEMSLKRAIKDDIAVVIATRCMKGGITKNASQAFEALQLTPVKARIALMLKLLSS